MGVVRSIVVTVVAVAVAVGALTAGTVVVLVRAVHPPVRAAAAAVRPAAPPTAPPLGLPSGTPPTGAAVPRSSSPSARYAAIAGSPSYLLYARTTRDDPAPVDGSAVPPTRDHRVLMDRLGRRTPVPARDAVSLLGDEPLLLRLATRVRSGAGLPVNGTGRTVALRWALPARGTTGTVPLPPHTRVVAFAPGGWVTSRTGGRGGGAGRSAPVERLTLVTTSGRRAGLGVPFPEGAPSAVRSGESGPPAISTAGDGDDLPSDGRIRFHAWSGGGWRTPDPGDRSPDGIACSTLPAQILRCAARDAHPAARSGVRHRPAATATPLSPRRSGACGVADVATPTGFLGVVAGRLRDPRCRPGTLAFVDATGGVTRSTRVYDRFHRPVIAFGRIVVDEAQEHRLLALRTVGGAPQVLVGR